MHNKWSKLRIVITLLLSIVLVLAVLLTVNRRTAPKSSFAMEGRNKLELTGEVGAVSNSDSIIYCVKDLLLEAQAENLRAKNVKGDLVWSQKLPGTIVKIADTGENIVIIDSSNNITYYSLQGKLLWSYKSPSEIIDIFTEDEGSFLVEYKGMTGSHAEIFTRNGSKAGSIAVENAHVLSFSKGVSSFSISILDTSAEIVKTKIITYNFKGDILWAQNFENIIISKLSYTTTNNRLFALGENTFYIFNEDGSIQSNIRVKEKISNIAVSDYMVAAVVSDKGKQYAVCYNSNLREQSRTEINEALLGIFPMKNSFIAYSADSLMVLTAKGELTARYKSNSDISSVYMTPEDQLYIVSNRKLQRLEYVK